MPIVAFDVVDLHLRVVDWATAIGAPPIEIDIQLFPHVGRYPNPFARHVSCYERVQILSSANHSQHFHEPSKTFVSFRIDPSNDFLQREHLGLVAVVQRIVLYVNKPELAFFPIVFRDDGVFVAHFRVIVIEVEQSRRNKCHLSNPPNSCLCFSRLRLPVPRTYRMEES